MTARSRAWLSIQKRVSDHALFIFRKGGVNGLDDGKDLLIREVNSISDKVKNGLNFGTASVGVNASYSGASRYGAQAAAGRPGIGWGNTYVTINSPEAVDGVQAARVWCKETQKMALAYI